MTDPTPDVKSLFGQALERPAAERAAFLDLACAGHPAVRAELDALLAALDRAGGFLNPPAPPARDEATLDAPAGNSAATRSFAAEERPGVLIAGRYKLLQRIGEGGMGTVWMADQIAPVKRRVAVKLIREERGNSKTIMSRFEAERQAIALMDHPHIAKLLDAGTSEAGQPFFVMELVKGVPLTDYCDAHRLSIPDRLTLFAQICSAVQHAHQKGVIHRDLKPTNILVESHDGRAVPKVIDFGLAKATSGLQLTEQTLFTAFGSVMGTPLYMAPEQATFNAVDVDTRADVYALGVILYELLCGTTPLTRETVKTAALDEMLKLIREQEAPPPSSRLSATDARPSIAANRQTEPAKLSRLMKGELDWIVLRALAKERERRYESAAALARDVGRHLTGEAVEACPPTLAYRLRKFVRRHKARIASIILVGSALLVGVVGTIWQAAERRHEREVVRMQSLQTASTAVDRAQAALIANRLGEVDAALAMIDPESVNTSVLTTRIETIRKDRDMLRELETIYEEYWTVCPSNTHRDPEKAKARYPQAFRNYGVPVGELSSVAASDRVKSSLIAPTLTDGLATWFFLDPKVEGLWPLLDRLDPDEFRVTVRAAVASENKDRLRELAKSIDPSQHPPVFSVMLAGAGVDAENYRILQAAWRRYPDSFAVVLAMAFPEPGVDEARAKERIGWSRMAVSLRPNNALAHYYFGVTHYWESGDDALNAFRRAVELAPLFANAHAQIGHQLRIKDPDAAMASFRRATEIDPNNIVGLAGLCDLYLLTEQWTLAARNFRLLDRLVEPDNDFCLSSYANVWLSGRLNRTETKFMKGLIQLNRYHELVELYRDVSILNLNSNRVSTFDSATQLDIPLYLPACAAVQAAAGRGNDPPVVAERARVRRLAHEWLVRVLELCELECCENDKLYPLIHITKNHWLSEPMLADVRGARIADLPKDEQSEWQQLWATVEGLRDLTAPPPPELAPKPPEPKK